MKTRKIVSFAIGILMLITVLGSLTSLPVAATTPEPSLLAEPVTYDQDVVVTPLQPILTLQPPILTLQPICSVKITDVYALQEAGDSYAEIIATGTAVGCNKIEVSINCAGQTQKQTVEVTSGFWRAVFDGTLSECICDETMLTVAACCVDPVGITCCDTRRYAELPCRTFDEDCEIYIRDVFGEKDPTGELTITVIGTAMNCEKVRVTITCGARLTTEAIVNADSSWKAVLKGLLAECECEKPITVNACCESPVTAQNCCASLSLQNLPCRGSDIDCLVAIERVFGILDPSGTYVDKVVIRGVAKYCRVVEVSMNCAGQEQRTKAVVDATGRWEVVLPGRLSECVCDQPITVKACCIDPPVKDCCATINLKALPCIKPDEECSIIIRDVRGEFTANNELNVHVTGTATGCKTVDVTIVCNAEEGLEFHATTTVDADGVWKLVFNALRAKCLCENPIYVKACCVEPLIDGCCDVLRLDTLPCPPVQEPCRVQILDVFGEGVVPGSTLIERVHVRGVALGCEVVSVSIQCHAGEIRLNVRVDPVSGRWEAIFPGIEAECMCGEPQTDDPAITVKACCIVPDYPNCCDYLRLAKIPCVTPEECKIHIEGVFAEPEPIPNVVSMKPPQGRILRVTVWGVARGCKTVQVTLQCGARQTMTVTVADSGTWTAVFDGILAECICNGHVYVEACCIDDAGVVKCCDSLILEQLPCPELPPEEDCFLEIQDVFGGRIELFDPLTGEPTGILLIRPGIHVRGVARGCRVVEVEVTCANGNQYVTKADVDPNTGRWLAIIPECEFNEEIKVRACCIVPDNVNCCDEWTGFVPEPDPEECKVWIEGVHPILDPDDDVPGRVHEVIVVGGARGCSKVQVYMNCAGNEQIGTAEVIDGFWRISLSGIPAECFCGETGIHVRVCCLDDAGNELCCDELQMDRLICLQPIQPIPITIVPVEQCAIEIHDVFAESLAVAAGVRVHVRGIAKGCKEVSVEIQCGEKAGIVRALGVVNPSTGRWEVVLDGVKADCNCDQRIVIRVCCIEPNLADCCAYLELPALPCGEPDDCRIWIEDVVPILDADGRVIEVIVVGAAEGCDTVQVTMNCRGNEQMEVVSVEPDGKWKATLNGIVAECFCDGPIYVKACCIDAAGNVLCCDALEFDRLLCDDVPPITTKPDEQCQVKIKEVIPEIFTNEAGEEVLERIIVTGAAEGCRKVEVQLDCQGKITKTAEVMSDGEWKVEFTQDELAEFGCSCGNRAEVTVICVDPAIFSNCIDRVILEDICSAITPLQTTTREPVITSDEKTESPSPGFAPGFGLIEAIFAVLALLGLVRLRTRR